MLSCGKRDKQHKPINIKAMLSYINNGGVNEDSYQDN